MLTSDVVAHVETNNMTTHGMVKEKVFIVDIRERTPRGIWKSPDQRKEEVG